MTRECPTCGSDLRPLFTSVYCPNDRCGKGPVSSDWRRILPKVPAIMRPVVEQKALWWGGVEWFVWEMPMMVFGPIWYCERGVSRDDLLYCAMMARVNPDGTLSVVKNRYGSCRIEEVPDA